MPSRKDSGTDSGSFDAFTASCIEASGRPLSAEIDANAPPEGAAVVPGDSVRVVSSSSGWTELFLLDTRSFSRSLADSLTSAVTEEMLSAMGSSMPPVFTDAVLTGATTGTVHSSLEALALVDTDRSS